MSGDKQDCVVVTIRKIPDTSLTLMILCIALCLCVCHAKYQLFFWLMLQKYIILFFVFSEDHQLCLCIFRGSSSYTLPTLSLYLKKNISLSLCLQKNINLSLCLYLQNGSLRVELVCTSGPSLFLPIPMQPFCLLIELCRQDEKQCKWISIEMLSQFQFLMHRLFTAC